MSDNEMDYDAIISGLRINQMSKAADAIDQLRAQVAELEAENERLSHLAFDASACMQAAIRSGDWVVDGACDPDAVLQRIDDERKPSPAKRKQAMAEIQAEAQRMGLYGEEGE